MMNAYTEYVKLNKNVEWMRLDQGPLPLLIFQMQSTNAIFFIGIILCSREYPPFQM